MDRMDQCIAENGELKKDEVRVQMMGGRSSISGKKSLGLCDHNEFEVVVPCINPCFFMTMTEREANCLWTRPDLMSLSTTLQWTKTLARTLYTVNVIFIRLSAFVGQGYR